MNLKQVRDTLNRFNDTVYHQNYFHTVISSADHLTYQIVTWIILCLVLFILTLTFIRFLNKKTNKIDSKDNLQDTNEVMINEDIVSNQLNNLEPPLQEELEAIVSLNQSTENKNIGKQPLAHVRI